MPRCAPRACDCVCEHDRDPARARARAKRSPQNQKIYICVCTQYGFYTVRGTVSVSRIGNPASFCVRVSCCLRLYIIFIVCLTHTRAHTVLPLRFTAENQIVGWHCSGAHVPRDTRSARRRRYAVKGNAGPSTQAGGDLCAEPSINPAQLVRGASLTQ